MNAWHPALSVAVAVGALVVCSTRVRAQPLEIRHLAGTPGVSGSADGAGSAARFDTPLGVAVDASGTVYVADTRNYTIRRMPAGGAVTTLVGLAGSRGFENGTGSEARFYEPRGIAVDAAGTLYVADSGSNTIRKVTPAGVVTTLAGAPWVRGSDDGTGSEALFHGPLGVAVDATGTVFVADHFNHAIRKITPAGEVTTLARGQGAPAAAGCGGTGVPVDPLTLGLCYPGGVAVDAAGTVYVADTFNHAIRRIAPSGDMTTLAGLPGTSGTADGTGSAARFDHPLGIAVDATGTVFVGDCENHAIRQVTPSGVVTTVAGRAGIAGSADGLGNDALFNYPCSLAVDAFGTVHIADASNHIVRVGAADADVDTLPDPWERQFGLDPTRATGGAGASGDPDGDGMTNAQEHAAGTHPRGLHTRYFAEGATGGFFDVRLALVNPSPTETATVAFGFQKPDGTRVPHRVAIPPLSRRTIDPEAVTGLENTAFSSVIESDSPVIADRTMTWGRGHGGHTESSVAAAATSWYLAEGATHSGFQLFYLLQNPTPSTAHVQITYLRPAPRPPVVRTYTVERGSRFNIWVNMEQELANTDISATIASDVQIVVERAMYLDRADQVLAAGHESAGLNAAATEWFLAEGATGAYFDLFVLIANPGASDADIEATYLLPDSSTLTRRYTVRAKSRFNIWVDHEDTKVADTAVSTAIRSTNGVPVIVERAMWWPGDNWYGAHSSPGAMTTGIRWVLAEGEVDPSRGLETYVLVTNTATTPADVRVMLLFEDGASAEQTFANIPPTSRFNVPVGEFFPASGGRRFGAVVESLGSTPAQIVVERAMYWDASGQRWAAGTSALATRLP